MERQDDLLVTSYLKQETVMRLLKRNFKDDKTKVNNDTLKLITKYIHLFIVECAYRTLQQAKTEDSDAVEIHHFEKILPQMISNDRRRNAINELST